MILADIKSAIVLLGAKLININGEQLAGCEVQPQHENNRILMEIWWWGEHGQKRYTYGAASMFHEVEVLSPYLGAWLRRRAVLRREFHSSLITQLNSVKAEHDELDKVTQDLNDQSLTGHPAPHMAKMRRTLIRVTSHRDHTRALHQDLVRRVAEADRLAAEAEKEVA